MSRFKTALEGLGVVVSWVFSLPHRWLPVTR